MDGIHGAHRLLRERRGRSLDQLGRDVDRGPLGRSSREHPEEVLGIGWGSLARSLESYNGAKALEAGEARGNDTVSLLQRVPDFLAPWFSE